jgi:hypothetical protein
MDSAPARFQIDQAIGHSSRTSGGSRWTQFLQPGSGSRMFLDVITRLQEQTGDFPTSVALL